MPSTEGKHSSETFVHAMRAVSLECGGHGSSRILPHPSRSQDETTHGKQHTRRPRETKKEDMAVESLVVRGDVDALSLDPIVCGSNQLNFHWTVQTAYGPFHEPHLLGQHPSNWERCFRVSILHPCSLCDAFPMSWCLCSELLVSSSSGDYRERIP